MAKCGCSGGGCSCQIKAGRGAKVSGSGSAANPYLIEVLGRTLLTSDTATIGLDLTGSGTNADPYVLTADYIGSPPIADQQASEFQSWGATVDLSSKTKPTLIRATLTANVTNVILPTWPSTMSGTITLVLSQDATGGRTWVQPGVSAFGVDIALTTTASARDVIVMLWTGAQWVAFPSAMNVS